MLLRQARDVEPGNPRWPAQIGYVSALVVLGVDMINQNGLPTRHNPVEAKGELHAIRALRCGRLREPQPPGSGRVSAPVDK